jgi:hypothetical protein
MASRVIWSRAGGLQIRDLLASLLISRLLAEKSEHALYVCSPYMTDFPLLDNAFGQFAVLFRERRDFGEKPEILFGETLIELSYRMPIRIITLPGEHAAAFLRRVVHLEYPRISGRFAPELLHEKGLLCPAFYVEGSMNFTYSGVYKRGEKITAHTRDTPEGRQKITAAELEFQRLWKTRENAEVPREP